MDQIALPVRKRKGKRLMNIHRVLDSLAFSCNNCTLFLKDLKISQFRGNMYSCVKGVEATTRFY